MSIINEFLDAEGNIRQELLDKGPKDSRRSEGCKNYNTSGQVL